MRNQRYPIPDTRYPHSSRSAFTLFEIVIVVAIIAVTAGIYFLVSNPAGELAQARNTKRSDDVELIMNAVRETIVEQGNEQFACVAGPLPTSSKNIGSASGSYNLAPCLIPPLAPMPLDPSASSSRYSSATNYSTGYAIMMSSTTGQITISAPHAELKKTISITR